MQRIQGKGNKERLCPLGKVAMTCLKAFKNTFAKKIEPEDPILVSSRDQRWNVRAVQKTLKQYLALAALPMDISPHKTRHSYATHLFQYFYIYHLTKNFFPLI